MNKAKILSLLVFLFSVSAVVMAQPAASGGSPSGAPIDGGLSLLVGGIAAYGVKKIRENRKGQII